MRSTDRLDRVRIASPCPVGWEQMTGDDRVRFCDQCSLHVYDIAEMTRNEAEALIANTEGRICARLYRRADGTIITRDCPVGSRAVRRRVARVVGAIFATIMSVCASVAGQKPSSKDKSSCQQQVKITRKVSESSIENCTVTGTIFDPNGAVVAGAKVTIVDQKTKRSRDTESNSEGRFLMAGLPPGTYDIWVKSPGFKKLEVTDVKLAAKETVSFELIPLPDATTVTVGIIAETPLIDTSTPGTIIISGELIRRLPIPE